MKIAFDITLLGEGLNNPFLRTGIHRVVENVYLELETRIEIELLPVCFNSVSDTEDYLRKIKSKHSIPGLLMSVKDQECLRRTQKLRQVSLDLKRERNKGYSFGNFLKRKKVKFDILRQQKPSGRIDNHSLNGIDLFHSPYRPIPSEILAHPTVIPFYTAYDMILIKHPEFFIGNPQPSLSHYLSNFSGKEWITCISESTKADLLEINPNMDEAQVSVVYLAAAAHFVPCKDDDEFRRVQQLYRLPEGSYFLSLSTLEPRKNIIAGIKAFAKLVRSRECSDASLVLVGGMGWDFESTLRGIEGIQEVKDRIILTGFVEDADLATIYSNAIAFIYMSFYEGFGLPPLEAMQCGIPVITSNNSSLPEVVGDAGILLEATAQDELSQAMLDFYKDASLREEYSKKSLKRAACFSWQSCADQMLTAYRKSLESR